MNAQRRITGALAGMAVRAAHQLYSQAAHERRYGRAVAAAHGTVPYYRERWVHGVAASERPPTPAADLDRHLARLFPIAQPLRARGELPPWLGEPRELFEALLLTEQYEPADPLLEIRPALLDWRHLGPASVGRYGVVLAPDAVAAPGAPALSAGAGATGRISLLGSAAELAAIEPRLEPAARCFVRVALDDDHGNRAVVPEHPRAALLYEEHLGYIGARAASCGQWHVNWRRVHCRATSAGLAFTKLVRRRPTLVDVVPAQTSFAAVTACAIHRSPVLVVA
jgi:hypothetical protein